MKKAKEAVISQAPLIHCITNPISINDCANVVLALGAKPIMAEHPKEVHEITALAKALAVNLGNITDARAESIFISGGVAKNAQIPCVIDVVGAACSALRMELAQGLSVSAHRVSLKAICLKSKRLREWTTRHRELMSVKKTV